QRQELSAFIASIDRQVEGEHDLDKRVNILREALDLHPGESHFEGALRLVQDKRDLVNSIVARAHLREEQGSYGDALNDWEILRTIYSQYPGLTFEVERLQKRRDQQVRIESKRRLVEQVDTCLHSSDYTHAIDLLQRAAAEFPNDAELAELEKLAQDGVKRKTEAHRLMTEGQDLCAQQKSAEGINLLRRAYELDENNSLARAVLANALVEQAHSTVENDWREAEKLAREALDLNPGHPMAKTIRTLVQDQKRETFIEECVSHARKLQASADLTGASARIEEGLSVYPREPRLIQIQEAVQRDLQTQRRQIRRHDLEELRSMEREIDAATDAGAKQALGERVRLIAEKYPKDGEVLSVANGFLHRLGLLEVTRSLNEPGSENATLTMNSLPTEAEESSLPGTSKVAAPRSSAVPSPPPPAQTATVTPSALATKPASPSSDVKHSTRPAQALPRPILAVAAAIVLVVAIFLFVRRHPTPPITAPPEAAPAAAVPVVPPPEPALPVMKLSSDTGTGRVIFDDQPAAEIQDGQWTLDKVQAGEHKLKFESPRGQVSFTFSTVAGAAPAVNGSIISKGVTAVVVGSQADHLRVYSSDTATKVSLDGQVPLDVPQGGLDLPSISAGAHELAVSRGHDRFKIEVEAGAAPILTAFLESGQDVGELVVLTGQEKVKVFLNGKLQSQTNQSGELRIPNLALKDYVVRVSKNGFQDPPEQKIRIRKDDRAKLTFELQPIPHLASLMIQGGAPGTSVLIDQTPVGTIQPDGTLNLATINPGDHVIELRKARSTPKQIKKHFVAGATISLTTAEVTLEAAPAELKINFTPADAQVTLARAGEATTKVSSGGTLNLTAGVYTLTAKTSDNFTRSSTVEVTAGQLRTLDLYLA